MRWKVCWISPVFSTFYWRNNETAKDSYYSGSVPNDNPIGSTIVCWASNMNGDENYRDIVFETNDKNLLEFPKEFNEMTEFKVIGSGEVELTVYLKYNPQIKEVFTLTVGWNFFINVYIILFLYYILIWFFIVIY